MTECPARNRRKAEGARSTPRQKRNRTEFPHTINRNTHIHRHRRAGSKRTNRPAATVTDREMRMGPGLSVQRRGVAGMRPNQAQSRCTVRELSQHKFNGQEAGRPARADEAQHALALSDTAHFFCTFSARSPDIFGDFLRVERF